MDGQSREPNEDASRESETSRRDIEFLDTANVLWRVTERDCRHDPGSRSHHCLIFTSDTAVRRVWVYPVDWRTLSGSALSTLSWNR